MTAVLAAGESGPGGRGRAGRGCGLAGGLGEAALHWQRGAGRGRVAAAGRRGSQQDSLLGVQDRAAGCED